MYDPCDNNLPIDKTTNFPFLSKAGKVACISYGMKQYE